MGKSMVLMTVIAVVGCQSPDQSEAAKPPNDDRDRAPDCMGMDAWELDGHSTHACVSGVYVAAVLDGTMVQNERHPNDRMTEVDGGAHPDDMSVTPTTKPIRFSVGATTVGGRLIL